MLIVFTRSIIIYILLIVTMRLMGKKQLGELQPFEFAITLIVAELACIPMSDTSVPISYGLVPILTLFVLEFAITKAVKHSIRLRKIVNGKPIIVINQNGIDYKAISNLDMTINDLLEALRGCNVLSPAEVEYAIIETNGKMSILQKAEYRTLQVSDTNILPVTAELPFCVVSEGKFIDDNIKKLNLNKEKVLQLLQSQGLKQKDVLLLSVKPNFDFYLQPINKKFVLGNMDKV